MPGSVKFLLVVIQSSNLHFHSFERQIALLEHNLHVM